MPLYKFNSKEDNELVNNLQAGKYQNLIMSNQYRENCTWISKKPNIKVFKDSSLQIIFITRGEIFSYDYYGSLFISDTSKFNDKRSLHFISGQFHQFPLGSNWFVIECYTEITPGS